MISGLIVAHTTFGNSLLQALENISGNTTQLYAISNEGHSTNDLSSLIGDYISRATDNGIIVFIDVFGGSCWRAAMMAKKEHSSIITGVNLPMLLSFVNKRDSMQLSELSATLEVDGKRAIIMK